MSEAVVNEVVLYRREQFRETPARQALQGFKGRYVYSPEQTTEEVDATIEKVKESLPAYGDGARFVFNRMFYSKPGDESVLDSVSFAVRPTRNYALTLNTNTKFEIKVTESFYDDLLEQMIQWLDNYEYARKLEQNIEYLNASFAKVIAERGESFKIEFTLGEGLVDARDDYALIGLTEDVVIDLSSTKPEYGIEGLTQMISDSFIGHISDAVAHIEKPYELLKVNSTLTSMLKIYSRKSLRKLMRNFVSRKMNFVHTGTGYFENADVFAVIDKKAVTAESEEALVAHLTEQGAEFVVIDNEQPTKNDIKKGLTRIVVSYRVKPFLKDGKEDVSAIEKLDLLDASKGIGHVEGKVTA